MKKKLNAYRGRLTPAQIAEGMNAANENSRRLTADADLLLNAGRFATAASLAVLSIEEAGKVSILRSMAVASNEDDISDEWKRYRSHSSKNVAWILPQLVANGAHKIDDLKPIFDQQSEHPYILDQLKQIGFYTDCLGKSNWSRPSVVIDESLARMLVRIASIFAKEKKVTEQEILLWIKHIGPVWKKNPLWMKQALINWYKDMQLHGLAAEGVSEVEQFEQFIR